MSLQATTTTSQHHHNFYPLKTLETEDSTIIDSNDYVNGSDNDANDEGRRINEHEKYYFMREAKHTCVAHSFEYLFLAL